jgi:hypothetical protein
MTPRLASRLVLLSLLLGCMRSDFHAPHDWINVGAPPDAWEVVLTVAREKCPAIPSAGYIQWTHHLFVCGSGPADAAGCAYPTLVPSIQVTYRDNVIGTALAHELGHVCGFTDGDALDAWMEAVSVEAEDRIWCEDGFTNYCGGE